MLSQPGEFAAGLISWLREGDDFDAQAAGLILAETILMWRRVLESKFNKKG